MARRAAGEGTIYRHGEQWRAQLTLPDGKRRTFYGATQQEVRRKLQVAKAAIARGESAASGRLTLGDWLSEWLAAKAATVEPSSMAAYRLRAARIRDALGAVRLASLTAADVRRFDTASLEAGLAPRTVRETHLLLGQVLQAALDDGHLSRNVARVARLPMAPKGEPRALDESQAARLVAVARDDPLEALWLLAVTIGARQGELLALTWADVDLAGGALTIRHGMQRPRRLAHPKSLAGRRRVLLPALPRAALTRRRETVPDASPGAYVFSGRKGGLLWQSTLHRQWKALAARAGLPPTKFHELRHTAATLMLRAGESPKVVAEILGHSDASLVLRLYGHVLPSMRQDAAARMDALLASLEVPPR